MALRLVRARVNRIAFRGGDRQLAAVGLLRERRLPRLVPAEGKRHLHDPTG
jgi:hypothetical protein